MKLLDKIKKWLTTGKTTSSEKIKEANRVSNYGGGVSSKPVQTEVKRSIVKAEAKQRGEEQTEHYNNAFKTTANKKTPPSVKKAEAKDKQTSQKKYDPFNTKSAFKAKSLPKTTSQRLKESLDKDRVKKQTTASSTAEKPKVMTTAERLNKSSTALGTMSKSDIESRTAKRNAYEANRKEQVRAAEKLKPKIDEKYSTRKSGAPAYAKQGNYAADPDVAKYNVLKHPYATSGTRGALSGTTFGLSELAINKLSKGEAKEAEKFYQANKSKGAEFAGEMAGSLLSYGGTAKGFEKLGERAVARTAETKLGRKLGAEALAKTMAGDGAKAAVARSLVGDAIQDSTVGLVDTISDVATRDDLKTPRDYLKAIAKGQAANYAMGLAGNVVANGAPAAREALGDIIGNGKRARVEPPRLTAKIGESIDDSTARAGAGKTIKDLVEERTGRPVDELISDINTSKALEDTKIKPITEKAAQVNLEDGLGKAPKEAVGEKQMTLDDAMKSVEERKSKPIEEAVIKEEPKKPKTQKQKKIEEQNERIAIDNVMRKREQNLAAEMREQTGGEYSYRQGEHTAAEHSSLNEAKRIADEQDKVYKQLEADNVKDLFADENTPFGIFKTANKAELKKKAAEATTRVRDDTYGAVHRLIEKAERLEAELTKNSALSSAEHITLDDIADITAIRNIYEEAGVPLPEEYEKAFSHVIEWQRTEAAQMLKSVDLFLKENDREYRRMFIARDVDRYLRKVLNADNVAIEDIKRSLDANHGAGYFDKMIEALAEFKGLKSEAEFRRAYADFQAEIFMNTKPTVWDTVNLWRHTFMLSSPKTGANNIIGNVLQRIMYNVSDSANLVGESMARAVNKDVKRTTAILKSKDQRRLANMFTNGRLGEHNLKNDKYLSGFDDQVFADTINRAADVDVADMMDSSKYMGDVIKGLKYKPTTAGGKIKQGFVKGGRFGSEYVSVMLNEPDSWFVERNYRSALLKYLEANGINSAESLAGNGKILKEARAYAKDVALENTYKKANNVVSFLEGLRRKGHTKGSNAGYKAAAIMLDAELPYLKVPANLIVNNFKYSPLGLGKGAVDAFRGAVKGDADMLNKATRELSKGLTGTGMAALGYMMFCKDQTDDDSWGFIGNAKDELKEYGVRDNSFKIGNHNYSIANLGIGSVQFLMGAALAEDLAEQGKVPSHQIALDSISKTVDTVADMSLMENAVSLLDAFGNGGDYNATVSDRLGNAATEIAGDYAAQFIPNPLRGVAKGMTDADLDTGVKKGDTTKVQRVIERNKNNFIQGVPVLNEKILPHRVDTHGNLIGERKTKEDKTRAILNNTLNPLSPKTVKIPEADKIELQVKDENGKPFKPRGFDPDRKYEATVGQGKMKEVLPLTAKEREQVARSAKNSGYDGAMNLVKKGMFGDRLGDRAQEILKNVPDDEEKAREYIFSTNEWKNADDEQRKKWLDAWYGQGQGNKGRGVDRTRNAEAYVNIKGNSDGDFRYQNDLHPSYQKKYEDYHISDTGVDKGTWADIVQSVYDASHKWDEENQKNIDTPNSAKKVKLGILAVEGLTKEQRIAAYQAYRGKRTGFGWNDWDGESIGGSGWRRWGYGWHRWGRGGHGKKASTTTDSSFNANKSSGVKAGSSVPMPKTGSSVNVKSTARAGSGAGSGARTSSGRVSVKTPTTSNVRSTAYSPSKIKSTASRMNANPKIDVTPLNIKTVKPSKSGKGKSSNLAAALKDIENTQKKVAPPKARRSK